MTDYENISTTASDSAESVGTYTECVVSDPLTPETFRSQIVEIGSCTMVVAFMLLCLGVVLWR